MREPRQKVIRVAAALVVGSVLFTVPLFTALAVEAARTSHIAPQGALLAPVALKYGGAGLLTALALTGAGLLFVAANLAFIGCYNVFKAVGEHGYLPAALSRRNRRYGTPRGAIIMITAASIIILVSVQGDLLRLGKIFAFGLLGSYSITSISLERAALARGQARGRVRERPGRDAGAGRAVGDELREQAARGGLRGGGGRRCRR